MMQKWHHKCPYNKTASYLSISDFVPAQWPSPGLSDQCGAWASPQKDWAVTGHTLPSTWLSPVRTNPQRHPSKGAFMAFPVSEQTLAQHWAQPKKPFCMGCIPVSGLQYWCLGHWLRKWDLWAPQVAVGCKKTNHRWQRLSTTSY